MKRVFWLGGCLLLSLSLQVIAQSIGGSLHGRVLDTQGNGVANAALTLRDQERGRERSLLTDGQGDYTLSGIEPGTYRLAVQAPGFASYLVVPEKKIKSINMPCSSNTTSCKIARNRLQPCKTW